MESIDIPSLDHRMRRLLALSLHGCVIRVTVIGLVTAFCVACAGETFAAERLTLSFNPDWKFIKADPNGAQQPGFDDRRWTRVSAPHTYNDVDTFDDWSIPGHRGGNATGFPRPQHAGSPSPGARG